MISTFTGLEKSSTLHKYFLCFSAVKILELPLLTPFFLGMLFGYLLSLFHLVLWSNNTCPRYLSYFFWNNTPLKWPICDNKTFSSVCFPLLKKKNQFTLEHLTCTNFTQDSLRAFWRTLVYPTAGCCQWMIIAWILFVYIFKMPKFWVLLNDLI